MGPGPPPGICGLGRCCINVNGIGHKEVCELRERAHVYYSIYVFLLGSEGYHLCIVMGYVLVSAHVSTAVCNALQHSLLYLCMSDCRVTNLEVISNPLTRLTMLAIINIEVTMRSDELLLDHDFYISPRNYIVNGISPEWCS